MLDINIAYPEFVPNQILTDRQLNQLHAHLEQEDRSTRLRLAGRGIICGLHARKVADTVEIDAGYGVTSDGDLIELCEQARTTYTHFRPYVDPDLDEEKKVKYVPWRSDSAPTQQFNIVELLPKEAMEVPDETQRPQGATKLTAAHLDPASAASQVAGRVLVLYLEHQPVELKSCLVTSCDNKGRNINVHVRALLVKTGDLPAATLPKDCRPVDTFPRHLMLGVLDGSSGAGRRHEFSPSPLREVLQADLRTDLEREERATRLRLAGVGIACGLHPRKVVTPAPAIEIDAGYGITSDGDLIELCDQPKTTYTHFRPYADPDRDEEKKLRYAPWRSTTDPTQQREIVELIPKAVMEGPAAERPAGAVPLTAAHLDATNTASQVAGRVLVLYLEHQPVQLASCLVACDRQVRVRALLVKTGDLPAATLPKDCRPVDAFPRHLMLGVLDGSSGAGRRHEFSPSPLREVLQADLRTDLEREERATRLRLAGVGIACGLHARTVSTPAPAIEIDAGYGVTSNGDLLELCDQPKTTYTHFRAYADPDRDEANQLRYGPWRSPTDATQQLDIVELIPALPDTEPPAGATRLTAAHLDATNTASQVAGRVLVLYREHQPVQLASCLVACDRQVRVRALLVKTGDLPAATLPKDCRPVDAFPRHLMLGVLDESAATGRRHEFSPSPLREVLQADLRTDLTQEDRRTRLRLAGVGIACGLHARKISTPAPAIEIDAGYGVTSNGDLLELCDQPKTTYTHFRAYADPDRDEANQLRYGPWRSPTDATQQLDIVELIPKAVMEGPEPPAGATPLTAAHLLPATGSLVAGRVLVLYLEHRPAQLESCLVTCDRQVRVRALLVNRDDLTSQSGCPAPPTIHRVRRLHTVGFPEATVTPEEIRDAFGGIVSQGVGPLSSAIKTAFNDYALFLDLPPVAADPLAGKLPAVAIPQYRYGALVDLSTAYNEAAAGAYALMRDCNPASTFPRHLMLGVLDGSDPTGFRNEFVASPLRNVAHGELDRVRDLFRRLESMISDQNPNFAAHPAAVGIQPSHTAAYPLGRRARPFYFGGSAPSWWRPRPRCTVDGDWPWLHPNVARGFDTDYAECSLLRIEGHVDKPWESARDDVVARRDEANLEFNVLCSFLDARADEELAARNALRDLLEAPLDHVAEASAAFGQWITHGKGEIAPILALSNARTERLTSFTAKSREWIALRNRRPLHCDTSDVARDYLQARSGLRCAVSRARGMVARVRHDLERLPDEALTGPGLEPMLEAAPFALVDHLVGAVIAMPLRWDHPNKIQDALLRIGRVDGPKALRPALQFALDNLDVHLQMAMAPGVLPGRVVEFDFELFAYFFRLALARSREFWHWARALGLRIPGLEAALQPEKDVPLHPAEEPEVAADSLGFQACLLARFATVSAAYESVRANDPSLFENLARVDGLEHLAGVAKGGTFVMVCEHPAADGQVVADFSLERGLPCCCAFDAEELCLPPLALPDVRVITLTVEEYEKGLDFPIQINVMANDCDLYGSGSYMNVELPSDRTALGSKVETAAAGIVRYTAAAGIKPGMVDRFEYRLQTTGDKCGGLKATGTVIVIFAVAPVLNGRIEGKVISEYTSPDGTVVTIEGTNYVKTTGGDGRFVFDAIPEGQYTLKATLGQLYASDPESAVVKGGETAEVRLILKKRGETASPTPPKGSIRVTVRNVDGSPVRDATVIVMAENEQPRVGPSDGQGLALFENLPAGRYVVTVQRAGTVTERLVPRELAGGDTLELEVTLGTARPAVSADAIDFLATTRDLSVLEANARLRKVSGDRYVTYVKTFNRATEDPRILASDARAAAAEFLGKRLTDSTMTEASLAAAYEEAAGALATAVREATGGEKARYQEALVTVTAAYLDHVALSNPKELVAGRSTQIEAAVTRLKSAGIAMEDVRTMWGGATLGDRGISSANAIGGLLE